MMLLADGLLLPCAKCGGDGGLSEPKKVRCQIHGVVDCTRHRDGTWWAACGCPEDCLEEEWPCPVCGGAGQVLSTGGTRIVALVQFAFDHGLIRLP